MSGPNIILTAVDSELAEAWRGIAADLDGVQVHEGSIFDVDCDAVVSPANSFGFMGGGIDALYLDHFGLELEARVQEAIRDHHQGELVVGSALVVETGSKRPRFLIAAPTMRVPMVLDDSVNPYLAARAALLLIVKGSLAPILRDGSSTNPPIQSVAFPGMGTGVGRMPAEVCARQVREAILEVRGLGGGFPATWVEARARHQELYTDQIRDLQLPRHN